MSVSMNFTGNLAESLGSLAQSEVDGMLLPNSIFFAK